MKTFITVLVLFVTTLGIAQQPIEKDITAFTELKVYDLIEVELIKADKNAISVTGYNANNVLITSKEETLKVKMRFGQSFDGNNTKVKLFYTDILIIDANEGSFVYSKETIKQLEVTLNVQEGAKIEVDLDVKQTHVRSVTGGIIKASGKSQNQDISIFTGGIYKAKLLNSEYTEVSIKAAGKAIVNASKNVIAKVVAGGNIYIYGSPEKVDETRVLGGTILVLSE